MVTSPTSRTATLLLLLLTTAPLAEAQEAATSLEQLQRLVKDGDRVTVTDTSGREITGRIADLTASSLTLLAATRRHDFAEDGIRMISQQRNDSLVSGAAWGAAAGAVLGLVCMAAITCDGCSWDPSWFPVAMVGLSAGMGAGVGIGIDALIHRRQVIYVMSATPVSGMRITSLLLHGRKGVLVSIGF